MGSFVFDDIVEPSINEPKPKKKKKERYRYRETASRDIRSMFGQVTKKIYQKESTKPAKTVIVNLD